MPTYERYKYCGHRTGRGYCGNTANVECMGGGHTHWDQTRFNPSGPKYISGGTVDHPRFVCDIHVHLYERDS